ncbi:MAG: tetratricopeptide repeat protein [Candidatus Dormibacteria bacterium]
MIKPPERVEIEEEAVRRERFARLLAVLIVIATLGVATAEYFHSVADRYADLSGVLAQKLSIVRQGQLVRASDEQRASIDNFAYAEQQRTEQANAFQEFFAPSVQSGSAQATLLNLAEDRWSTLADLTGSLTLIKSGDATSPSGDPQFPTVILSQAQKPSDITFAVQDAMNQLRSDWQGRAGLFTVVLTLFAVATYLFGLSLSLHANIRRYLTGLGVVLMAIGVLGGAALLFLTPESPSELCEVTATSTKDCNQSNENVKAATAYADGVYDLNTFYTQPGVKGLQDADAAFTDAINARPRFAQAYLDRAQVRFLLGSPQGTGATAALANNDALQEQGSDLQHAYDLGLRDKLTLNDLAANRLLLAITQGNSGEYSAAVDDLNDALQLDPNDPILYFNKGLALIGQGDQKGAQQAYQDAVAHTVYADVGAQKQRNDAAAEERYVAGALTTLDLLGAHRNDLSQQVASMKQLIVNGVEHRAAASGSPVTIKNMAISVFPGQLQWTGDIDNYDPTKANTSTQWYYQDPNNLGWSVVPSISGVNAPVFDNSAGPSDAYFLLVNYVKATQGCLQPGKYKAEVYVDGVLAGTATADGTQPSLMAQPMPDLGLAFCSPPDWSQDQMNFLRGFSNGFASKDRSRGAYFFVLQNPEEPSGTAAGVQEEHWRDELLGSNGLASNALPKSAGALAQTDDTADVNNLGIGHEDDAVYSYSGGELEIDTAVAPNGSIVAAFVFAPDDQWNGKNSPAGTIFKSMVSTQ